MIDVRNDTEVPYPLQRKVGKVIGPCVERFRRVTLSGRTWSYLRIRSKLQQACKLQRLKRLSSIVGVVHACLLMQRTTVERLESLSAQRCNRTPHEAMAVAIRQASERACRIGRTAVCTFAVSCRLQLGPFCQARVRSDLSACCQFKFTTMLLQSLCISAL